MVFLYIKVLLEIIAEIAVFIIYFFTPVWIKNRIIKKRHLRQLKAIQPQASSLLQSASLPKREIDYSLAVCLASMMALFPVIIQLPLHYGEVVESWPHLIEIILIAALVYYSLDLIFFYIRLRSGRIQGAVLFDPKTKMFYAFPSANSEAYKEYHQSELFYAKEWYYHGKALVFFVKGKEEPAFKLDSSFSLVCDDVLYSRWKPVKMSVPFKYRYHTLLLIAIAIIITFLSLFCFAWLGFPLNLK